MIFKMHPTLLFKHGDAYIPKSIIMLLHFVICDNTMIPFLLHHNCCLCIHLMCIYFHVNGTLISIKMTLPDMWFILIKGELVHGCSQHNETMHVDIGQQPQQIDVYLHAWMLSEPMPYISLPNIQLIYIMAWNNSVCHISSCHVI